MYDILFSFHTTTRRLTGSTVQCTKQWSLLAGPHFVNITAKDPFPVSVKLKQLASISEMIKLSQ